MSVQRMVVIVCDGDDYECGATAPEPQDFTGTARDSAARYGWTFTEDEDLCPEHSPKPSDS
ncbi:hypothetical protein KXS11_03495 [Plantibacter flavus]|uniref:hypothetical protein n=1 Tax=Plantibacter flavus TaxID=150123 RepID=UPI003F1775B8